MINLSNRPVPPSTFRYQLFGVSVQTDFVLTHNIPTTEGDVDLTIERDPTRELPTEWRNSTPPFRSAITTDEDEHALSLYVTDEYYVLHYAGVADFYLWQDYIACVTLDPAYDFMIEIHLLGLVFSVWLELREVIALHASAVVVDDEAVLFLASNTGGKSSLAASFAQKGYKLVSDDIVPITLRDGRIWASPGYPQMRMWPDLANHFIGEVDGLEIVHPKLEKLKVPVGKDGFGAFAATRHRVKAIYLPEMTSDSAGGTTQITDIAKTEAVFHLTTNSFAIHLLQTLPNHSDRFRAIAEIASRVQTKRLTYPRGLSRLEDVIREIKDDLSAS